jgi:putative glutathione S-transferase
MAGQRGAARAAARMSAKQDPDAYGGEFLREDATFRDWVGPDPRGRPPGPAPEPGRFHLYVALACPWSHRAVIVRDLAGLGEAVPIHYLDPYRDARGWAFTSEHFEDGPGGEYTDRLHGWSFLREAYLACEPGYSRNVTVPVLWDEQDGRIVNNESSEIIRMLDSEFGAFAKHPEPLYLPEELRTEIDELNAFVYENVNDGVYRTGFARTQAAYEHAFGRLFDALDELDARLATRRYLLGNTITEADWRLFTTLLRFDPVYVGHFKCNLRRVIDYPQLSAYLRDLYQYPGIAATVDMDHIKRHYYRTHPTLNPTRIVPVGPALDLAAPHGRERLG